MRSVHRYTLICILLAAVFILGSMAGMNLILQEKESRLLQESGTAQIESPVAVWQEPEDSAEEETEAASEQEERRLTIEQIEEVVSYRANASEEILHEPVSGQIPMEEAIASAENWIVEMGFADKDPQVLARRASLGVRNDREISSVPMEPYYSFWTVHFSNKFMYAELSVNAVTGKVWDAEIILYNDLSSGFSWEKLALFLELAGIQEDAEDTVEINEAGALLRIRNSALCAEMTFRDIQTVVERAGENGSWGFDDDIEVVEHNEYIRRERYIMYRLISS